MLGCRRHDAAGRSGFLFAAEQFSVLIGGLTLWTAIFTARGQGAALAAALVAFATFSHMSIFGLLLALTPRLVYDPSLCQGAFGLDRLGNQHLGGVLMASAGLVYLLAAITLFGRITADTAAERG